MRRVAVCDGIALGAKGSPAVRIIETRIVTKADDLPVHAQVAGLWPGAPTKSAWGTAKTGPGLVEFWLVPHRPYLATPHLRIRVN